LVPVCRGANPEPYWLIIRLRRCLATWALAAARGAPVRKVLRQRGWSKSTFYRKLDGGVAPHRSESVRRCERFLTYHDNSFSRSNSVYDVRVC
jgi:hypothetical protein